MKSYKSIHAIIVNVLISVSAFGVVTTALAVDIDWQNLGQGNSTVLTSGSVVTATNNTCTAGVNSCDATATVTYQINNNGQGGELACGWNSGAVCAAYFNTEFGGINNDNIRFALDATGGDNNDHMNVCVAFDRVVKGLSFDILDVDDAGWDDVVELYYTSSPSATPMQSRTDLINAADFGDVSTGTDANHVIAHDPSFAAPNNEAKGWGAIQPEGGNAANGDDGGNISIDFDDTDVWGFCMRYWAGPTSATNPPFQWIGISSLSWTSTLPVNLDYFSSQHTGQNLEFKWSTSSESFNVGFNLWAEIDGEWQSLNKNWIRSKRLNAYSSSTYKKSIKINRNRENITKVGISSVDSRGNEEFYGPFEIGETYGEVTLPEPISWEYAVAQKSIKLRNKGYIKVNNRWIKPRANISASEPSHLRADIVLSQSGMVRIHHRELIKAGLDLTGLRPHEIAVSYQGNPVTRRVSIGRGERTFNRRSYIDFYADNVKGELSLYNDQNIYQISANNELVSRAKKIRFKGEPNGLKPIIRTLSFEQDRLYVNSSKLGSPWVDEAIGYGGSSTMERRFTLPSDYIEGNDISLNIDLIGGFDFQEIENDHIASIRINGHTISTHKWGGVDAQNLSIAIPATFIKSGENSLQIEVKNNTYGFALQYFDRYEIHYPSEPLAIGGTAEFAFNQDSDSSSVQLSKNTRQKLWVYARDTIGNLVSLSTRPTKLWRSADTETIVLPRLSAPEARYMVLSKELFKKPASIEVVKTKDLQVEEADLYIVADASFTGQVLDDYVNFKRTLGIRTVVVTYQSLVEQLGLGMDNPMVIHKFLIQQNAAATKASVLIVGGHTYDYLNKTGQGSVSFIPTLYRRSNIIEYSPTDTPITDLDLDGLADVAVGRWPVRTIEQLEAIVSKSIKWASGEGLANTSSVLLISENDDKNSGVSFSQQLNELASRFDTQNQSYPDYWSSITRIYSQDYDDTATQQRDIRSSMNSGNSLTIYNGHGSPTSWSYKRLMDVNGVNSLEQNSMPGILIPLACYTTYYETISNESLANKLLFKKDGGAVMIAGAATLGEYTHNGKMLNRIMKYQARDGVAMGEAIKMAKRSFGKNKTEHSNLWTLLGDPTLRFNANYQREARQIIAMEDSLGGLQPATRNGESAQDN